MHCYPPPVCEALQDKEICHIYHDRKGMRPDC